MIKKIILASKSGVRKKILDENNINSKVIPSNIDEDQIKESLLGEKATPKIISKNLAELKANKISEKIPNKLVLGADSVIDLEGNPSSNPRHYFEGGAILPAGKQKGYALALVAEIMAEALLGPSTTEANWLLLVIDCSRYRGSDSMHHAAENVLDEIRNCPPAPGFKKVEIPGERERNCRKASQGKNHVPSKTW